MCGIIGYIGHKKAAPILIDALSAMEYRGYDSAGIAMINEKDIDVYRCKGKVADLRSIMDSSSVIEAVDHSHVGIGHTRWATHGRPCEENAHPHRVNKIVVVHNGIIENHLGLRDQLVDEGRVFLSETDTEVIPHLIDKYYDGDLQKAVSKALMRLDGSYSLVVMHADHPELLIAARNQSPLVIGQGEGESFVASDIPAILPFTKKVLHMHDGELACITKESIALFNAHGQVVNRPVSEITWSVEQAQKGGFDHFMLKEIFEQPDAFLETIKGRLSETSGTVHFDELGFSLEQVKLIDKIIIVSCGTSWHAGLVGRRYIERLAKIPVSVEYAAEFRYNELLVTDQTLVIAISQSGETADTLAAVRHAKKFGVKVISICNVLDSSLTRESDGVIYTQAGPEIGVASTKAFTCQMAVLHMFALYLAQARGYIALSGVRKMIRHLREVPDYIRALLDKDNLALIQKVAKRFYRKKNFIYLGRGVGFAIALEGALKLKEISYIHAEGYHAGEMKHGPIALVDKNMPVVALALKGRRYDKIMSNIEEIKARNGKVIAIATEGDELIEKVADEVFWVPDVDTFVTPYISVIPLQLLSYYIAVLRGCDVDQPRNLAKSVTVE